MLILRKSRLGRARQSVAVTPYAALPLSEPDVTFSLPSGGSQTGIGSAAALQAAIDSAALNTYIVVNADIAGANISLPKKTTGSGFIYIVNSQLASLPGVTGRVNPTDHSSLCPLLTATGGSPFFKNAVGAHHYRFVGFRFTNSSAATSQFTLGGNAETDEIDLPRFITIDRCMFLAHATLNSRRALAMSGLDLAIINSYFQGFKDSGSDSQAFWAFMVGRFLSHNNFIQAASENFLAGTESPTIANFVNYDLTFRKCHFHKPTSWNGTVPIKNLFELKNAKRVLLEQSLLENQWEDSQDTAINLKSTNQYGDATWATVQDVTVRYNKCLNIANFIKTPAHDDNPASIFTNHILAENNLAIMNSGNGRALAIIGDTSNVRLRKNTLVRTSSGGQVAYIEKATAGITDLQLYDNVITGDALGIDGPTPGEGEAVLAGECVSHTEHHNSMIGRSSGYGTGTTFETRTTAKFTNAAALDFTLDPTSPLKNSASDGGDKGANVAQVEIYALAAQNG